MAESGVILPADAAGKALRTESVTTTFTTGSGGVVHQQVITLADSTGVLLGTSGAPLPVSLATNTPTLAAGTNQIGTIGELRASLLCVTATAALTTATTATLPAVASAFHYITNISITAYSAAARTGSATPWVVTSTNLPGTPSWTFSTAGAIGTNETQTFFPTTPLRSSTVNTATTIVGPAATSVIWRITVSYFTGA